MATEQTEGELPDYVKQAIDQMKLESDGSVEVQVSHIGRSELTGQVLCVIVGSSLGHSTSLHVPKKFDARAH